LCRGQQPPPKCKKSRGGERAGEPPEEKKRYTARLKGRYISPGPKRKIIASNRGKCESVLGGKECRATGGGHEDRPKTAKGWENRET